MMICWNIVLVFILCKFQTAFAYFTLSRHVHVFSQYLKKSVVHPSHHINEPLLLLPRSQNNRCITNLYGSNIHDEDLRILEQQFTTLAKNKDSLTFKTFFLWDEIQALIAEDLFTKEEIQEMWCAVVSDVKKSCSLEQFIEINRIVDDELDINEDEDIDEDDEVQADDSDENDKSDRASFRENIWSEEYDPKTDLIPEFYEYLKNFFDSRAIGGQMNYTSFSGWTDVTELLEEGNMDLTILDDLWGEACERKELSFDTVMAASRAAIAHKERTISFDTFLRLNLRLNEVVEEVDAAIEGLDDADYDEYYRTEFRQLTNTDDSDQESTAYLSLKKLLAWPDLIEAMQDFDLKKEDVAKIWNELKLTPFREPASAVKNGFASKGDAETVGINEDEFVNFNYLFDEYLKSLVPPGPVDMDAVNDIKYF